MKKKMTALKSSEIKSSIFWLGENAKSAGTKMLPGVWSGGTRLLSGRLSRPELLRRAIGRYVVQWLHPRSPTAGPVQCVHHPDGRQKQVLGATSGAQPCFYHVESETCTAIENRNVHEKCEDSQGSTTATLRLVRNGLGRGREGVFPHKRLYCVCKRAHIGARRVFLRSLFHLMPWCLPFLGCSVWK